MQVLMEGWQTLALVVMGMALAGVFYSFGVRQGRMATLRLFELELANALRNFHSSQDCSQVDAVMGVLQKIREKK